MKSFIAGAALVLSVGVVNAQQIEWKQVQNTPKGLNLPQGVQPDILGIALGESFDEVKPKFEKLLAEVQPPAKPEPSRQNRVLSEAEIEMGVMANREALQRQASSQMSGAAGPARVDERETVINIPVPGGNIQAKYVSALMLTRETPGASGKTIRDFVQANFSAPSSGRQLYAITRGLMYYDQADQPRISEMMTRLAAKLRSQPQVFPVGNVVTYRFQFDNGQAVAPAGATSTSCVAQYGDGMTSASLRNINTSGNCDVVLNIEVTLGISQDHARIISFRLGDNERIKANIGADFGYVQNYARDFQNRSRGAPPKL